MLVAAATKFLNKSQTPATARSSDDVQFNSRFNSCVEQPREPSGTVAQVGGRNDIVAGERSPLFRSHR
jgi:hypothetical protein